ncbi:hypothetical protein [Natrinema saccharevitans]|uniref:hypothetical protein n=1 Tax=Natrinema saccharevitans TaxID=301967 RepID=UPI001FE87EAE|nr:hypothetical protein [Natrinema saccharevitans]
MPWYELLQQCDSDRGADGTVSASLVTDAPSVEKVVRERTTAGVCLVDVSSLPADDERELATLMRTVMDRLKCDPWDLADHPRFRLAVAQRYNIRAKWRYWSRADTTGGSVSSPS